MLAIGIGISLCVFEVINSILLRPLPFRDASNLVQIWETQPNTGESLSVSFLDCRDWQSSQESMEGIALYQFAGYDLVELGTASRLVGACVTDNFFEVLKLRPIVGDLFSPNRQTFHGMVKLILSEDYWRKRYQADASVIGRVVKLNGVAAEIIGVVPRNVNALTKVDIYVTTNILKDSAYITSRSTYNFQSVARLRANSTLSNALHDLDLVAKRLALQYPDTNKGVGVQIVPLIDSVVGGYRQSLVLIQVGTLFIWTIICANVANLLLTRALARQPQTALQIALGATRADIFFSVISEAIILSLLAGCLGLWLAQLLVKATLVIFAPLNAERFQGANLSLIVFLAAMVLSLLTSFICGAIPAWRAFQCDPLSLIKSEGNSFTASKSTQHLTQTTLVVIQIAITGTLLTASGILSTTIETIRKTNIGFNPHQLLAVRLTLSQQNYSSEEKCRVFIDQALNAIARIPGVSCAAAAANVPLSGESQRNTFNLVGQAPNDASKRLWYESTIVSREYFRTMNIGLLGGREFTDEDTAESIPVIIIDERFAKQFFPGKNPIGERIITSLGEEDPRTYTIIGIASTVRHEDPGKPASHVQAYFSLTQQSVRSVTLLLRLSINQESVIKPLQNVISSIEPNQPIGTVYSFDKQVKEILRTRSIAANIGTWISLIAALLAGSGLYCCLTYSVIQRSREIAIRIALGAQRSDILQGLLMQGCKLTGLGLSVGLVTTLILQYFFQDELNYTGSFEAMLFIKTAIIISMITLCAVMLSSTRFLFRDPLGVLRAN
jgi:putative ABC transport system permease protein